MIRNDFTSHMISKTTVAATPMSSTLGAIAEFHTLEVANFGAAALYFSDTYPRFHNGLEIRRPA